MTAVVAGVEASIEVPGLALVLGLIAVVIVIWLVTVAWWFNWRTFFPDGDESRVILATTLGFTFGVAFLGTTWIEPSKNSSANLVDVIQKGLVVLTLVSALSAATIYWFNRPRFLVPSRYRNDRGRWADRAVRRGR